MSIRVNPYLSFAGNAREALEFYRSVFGGSLNLTTFADIHASKDPSQDQLVAHATLTGSAGIVLMGSDRGTSNEHDADGVVSIALGGDDEAALTSYWERLSSSAVVAVPFAASPWGALFGRCTDQFGTDWLVDVQVAETSSAGQGLTLPLSPAAEAGTLADSVDPLTASSEWPNGATEFTYSNLSDRPPSAFVTVARRFLRGVDHVENEIAPYAADWHTHNITALGRRAPLWVVLGDSLSQGVGATSIHQSWVLQAADMLTADGIDYRIVNLSTSGARVMDVVERQIPAMNALGAAPDLTTVLVGSNDVVRHDLREELLVHYAALLEALPTGALVAVADRPFGVLSEVSDLVHAAAASGAVYAVPARLGTRDRAEDHFHLNDHGYRLIAEDFVAAIKSQRPHHPSFNPQEQQ